MKNNEIQIFETTSCAGVVVLMTSGEVREYPRPVTVAQVLENASDGDWFLSDADEGPVLAVRDAGSRDFF